MKDDVRRLLPPMASLHAFAAAARTDSFSRAAAEIGLTQGAVSRQVAQLEQWVGRRLFHRRGRRVALNADGRAYAAAVAPALAAIRRATRDALAPAELIVELAVLPGFGMRWLAPRLPGLSAAHPDIVVNLTARSDEFDLREEMFDAAIHFGRPEWPDGRLDLLFDERSVPVVSPSHAGDLRDPADLARLPLLSLRSRPDAWRSWFERWGDGTTAPAGATVFDQFLMMAQAVVAGAGAALLPQFLIEPELSEGSLVIPFEGAMESEYGYYLVRPASASTAATDTFAEWLLSEAASAQT